MTKKKQVIEVLSNEGFISYAAIEQLTGSKASNLFKGASLANDGVAKATLNGVKGLRLANKTQTARLIVASLESAEVELIKEVTEWDAHVFGSVFRASNLTKFGLKKEGKVIALVNAA